MTEDPGRTRPYADVLLDMNRGRTHVELSNELQALVQAVRATGKKGTLTFSVTVVPSKVDGGVELVDTVKSVLPKFDRNSTLFFADDEGNLTRHDPRQMELPIGPTRIDTDRRQEEAQ